MAESTVKRTGSLSVFDILKMKKQKKAQAERAKTNGTTVVKKVVEEVINETSKKDEIVEVKVEEKDPVSVTQETLNMLSKMGQSKKAEEKEPKKEKKSREKKMKNESNEKKESKTKIKTLTDGMIEAPELLKEMKERKANKKKMNETKNKEEK